LKREKFAETRAIFRELTTLRRHPEDWILLAECEKVLGNTAGELEAEATAIRINPERRR